MTGTVTPADTSAASSEEISLAGQQLALHSALAKKNSDLANMYLGALMVFSHPNNPEKHVQAAHSIREIIEKLPLYLDISEKKKGPSLKEKCIDLANSWKNKALKSSIHNDGEFEGEIDSRLNSFFKDIATFIEWFKNDNPNRKEEKKKLLRELDGYGMPMPNAIEKSKVDQLDTYQRYFTVVSHHNKEVDADEFQSYLHYFEIYLLDIFVPRTFEIHEEIDALIAMGEADD